MLLLMLLYYLLSYISLFVAPNVSFAYRAYSVDEYDGPALLTLTLSNPSSTTITIKVFTTDGSATGNHFPCYYNILLQVLIMV